MRTAVPAIFASRAVADVNVRSKPPPSSPRAPRSAEQTHRALPRMQVALSPGTRLIAYVAGSSVPAGAGIT